MMFRDDEEAENTVNGVGCILLLPLAWIYGSLRLLTIYGDMNVGYDCSTVDRMTLERALE